MTTTPMSTRPGEPEDPDLRDRYARDAWERREAQRLEAARAAAETPPSRTPRGPIRVIAALVAAALLVAAGISLAGPMLRQTESRDTTLPTGLSSLSLKNGVGDVRIRVAQPGETPKLTSTVEWGLRKPTTSVETSTNGATIRGRCPTGPVSVCSTDWLIVVPPDTENDVDQGVGQVRVEGTSGDLDIMTGVGDVRVSDAAARDIAVEVGVGGARIESVEPPRRVQANLGVGDLVVAVPDTVRYRVRSTGGAAEVRNSLGSSPSAERRIDAEVGVGGVRIEPS